MAVVIWDWAIGKKHHSFLGGHTSNIFEVFKRMYQLNLFIFLVIKETHNLKFLG